jgi:coenzyme F420-reducing hydrogenase beta subunit
MGMEGYQRHLTAAKEGFEALQKIIDFVCSRCGLCASICPENAIEMIDSNPTLTGHCTNCGLCYLGCPRSFVPVAAVKARWYGEERTVLEKRVGRIQDRFTARSLDPLIYEGGTNGGTATALIHFLLERGHVDAVLHVGSEHEESFICHHAKVIVSESPEDTLAGQHSKQHITPILHELERMSDYANYAIVALSCHTEAIRKLQAICGDPDLRELFKPLVRQVEPFIRNLRYLIGINCWANLKYGAIDTIYEKFGIEEESVIKFAETSKKSLYRLLDEGKDFFWFASDVIMTDDHKIHPLKYGDFLEDVLAIGCSVCPSFIVCKEADVSIGVTASERSLKEYGYNSVFVRHPELREAFVEMVREGRLMRRPMWENRGRWLRPFVERMIPEKDVLNQQHYVATGSWDSKQDLYQHTGGGFSSKIMGLQRLFLLQTVKRKFFFNPAVEALKSNRKFYTDFIT